MVQCAWRVYPDDVDLTKADSPLDVLKLFVFGLASKCRLATFAGNSLKPLQC